MNELIGVAFSVVATLVNFSASTTVDALASIIPCMFHLMESHIALTSLKMTVDSNLKVYHP